MQPPAARTSRPRASGKPAGTAEPRPHARPADPARLVTGAPAAPPRRVATSPHKGTNHRPLMTPRRGLGRSPPDNFAVAFDTGPYPFQRLPYPGSTDLWLRQPGVVTATTPTDRRLHSLTGANPPQAPSHRRRRPNVGALLTHRITEPPRQPAHSGNAAGASSRKPSPLSASMNATSVWTSASVSPSGLILGDSQGFGFPPLL